MRIRLKSLSDQVVVITGASSGIGLVTARMAAAAGARVVLVARNEDALRSLTEEIQGQGGRAASSGADRARRPGAFRAYRHLDQRRGSVDFW
jgi:NADP-dependent 3-hydroxy acid dehydrogenase YdfG